MYSPSEYLSNFTWFPFWLKRNYTEILEHLGTIILPVLFFSFFLKKKNINKEIFNKKKIIYLFLFLNIIFWLNFSPVYRFGIHIFVTLSFIILLDLLISKEFSKSISDIKTRVAKIDTSSLSSPDYELRIKDLEEAVNSMDSFRRQTNQSILKLKDELSKSISNQENSESNSLPIEN